MIWLEKSRNNSKTLPSETNKKTLITNPASKLVPRPVSERWLLQDALWSSLPSCLDFSSEPKPFLDFWQEKLSLEFKLLFLSLTLEEPGITPRSTLKLVLTNLRSKKMMEATTHSKRELRLMLLLLLVTLLETHLRTQVDHQSIFSWSFLPSTVLFLEPSSPHLVESWWSDLQNSNISTNH